MEQRNQSNSNVDSVADSGRRQLIFNLLGFSIVFTVGGVLTPILGYLWPPERSAIGGGGRVEVGPATDFPPNQGKIVPVNDKPVMVVNTGNQIKAYSGVCTHLGCIVEFDQARQFILCPCHDGRFNAMNGAVISGPVPAPLPTLTVIVDAGTVYVDSKNL